ncbi:MAG TPA: TatD family hydrolase [Candidatus Coprousia avicola]|nr:TatD family hydrolase [Candidatus Coprousia avicola]
MSTVNWRLVDMHCHLDRMSNAEEVAREAAERGIALFDTTVTPADARAAQDLLGSFDNVRVGTGLHPWWLADGRCSASDAARAAELAGKSPFVGEVGLDFGRRGDGAQELQTTAFEDICRAIAHHPLPHRVISIHAIRAASTALDILERTGILGEDARHDTVVIFHWFSGTSDELARARRLGCHFSVNEHMLRSKRGREYARQLPSERLLLETDAPPGLDAPYSANALEASLTRALSAMAEVRNERPKELGSAIAETSTAMLGLD